MDYNPGEKKSQISNLWIENSSIVQNGYFSSGFHNFCVEFVEGICYTVFDFEKLRRLRGFWNNEN